MKYTFLFSFLLLNICFFSYSSNALAQSRIQSFNDSEALKTISQFMVDNAEDMKFAFHISDHKIKSEFLFNCASALPSDAIKEVSAAISAYTRRFPDEELPVNEALSDLTEYLGENKLLHCRVNYQTKDRAAAQSSYYFSEDKSVTLKVDTIALHNK